MDSEQVRITPSEKTKLYLTKKLSEIEIKLKRMKKKKYNSDNRQYIDHWINEFQRFDS